ncbi:glutathione transferase GstA [Hydrogenophilus thiooxidans]|uniref:glutathione transferase GstA n=1 Tax=Hydrogenophilus TaxID=70774 RepID=UPI001C22F609|nr:glutathione transferase GstA [Hydrogenophilus thiooxidans]
MDNALTLYYSPGACSLSPHIALREAELPFALVRVDLAKKQTETGEDFRKINPNGYVPCLQLTDGRTLTEGPAIVQYIADQVPEKGLAPANGTWERYQLQQWLNFISTEIHKSYSPLFKPNTSQDHKNFARDLLTTRLEYVAHELAHRPYLLGERYSVADIYLFVTLSWAPYVALDLTKWPSLTQYQTRVGSRPAVQAALRAEGLIKS